MEKRGPLLREAVALLRNNPARNFSLSSQLPKGISLAEENLWDREKLLGKKALKTALNPLLVLELEKKTGKQFRPLGAEARLVFKWEEGKVSLEPEPLYVFGRYCKYSREMAQSHWDCKACGGSGKKNASSGRAEQTLVGAGSAPRGAGPAAACDRCNGKGVMYCSLEDELRPVFLGLSGAKEMSFHASGREDVDARMLGEGRPFILVLRGARRRDFSLEKAAAEVKKKGRAETKGLKFASPSWLELVTESHFDKEYRAEVELGRRATQADLRIAEKLEGAVLEQQTPLRVLRRRADLVRRRRIKKLRAELVAGKMVLTIKAEAGTYIKELISGDEGRTKPNLAALLGTKAACTALDVVKIYDGYLECCQ